MFVAPQRSVGAQRLTVWRLAGSAVNMPSGTTRTSTACSTGAQRLALVLCKEALHGFQQCSSQPVLEQHRMHICS